MIFRKSKSSLPVVNVTTPVFEELIASFEILTKLTVSVQVTEKFHLQKQMKNRLLLKRQGHRNPYCVFIKKKTRYGAKCNDTCMHLRLKKSQELAKPFIDECPFGVRELVIPFFSKQDHVVTLFCGQIAKLKDSRKQLEYLWNIHTKAKININKRMLEKLTINFLYLPAQMTLQFGNLLFFSLSHLSQLMNDLAVEQTIKIQNNHIIKDAIRILLRSENTYPSETDIAKTLGVSAQYFSRLFKNTMKKKYIDFLTEFKISRAQQLLVHTDLSIVEIAYAAGYGRHSYFSDKFNRITGMSPRQFRKSHTSK